MTPHAGKRPSCQRIDPPKSRKPAEVRVIGVQLGLIFDGQGGEVKVGRQLATDARAGCETPHQIEVPRAGMNDLGLRLSHPGADVANRFVHRHRIDQDPPARHDADEPEKNGPGQADAGFSGERLFPPALRLRVLRRIGVVRIDQEIDVGDQHRLTDRG